MLSQKIIYLGSDTGFEAAKTVINETNTLIHCPADSDSLGKEMVDASAILDASMKTRITDAMLSAAPGLRVISCATTGSDHIDRNALSSRGIPVYTLREDRELLLNLTPAAEHTWALLMACTRKIPAALEHVRSGGWTRELFPGAMLKGKALGLIGCGRIGTWMSRYAHAFGMKILGFDPGISNMPENITGVSLEELVSSSDVISIHVHLTEETRNLMSAELFKKVKPGVIFINTSRGAVADENGLLEGLNSGRVSAAGLDVLVAEPDIGGTPLVEYARNHDNLIITPHCGGFSPDAVAIVCARAAEKIRDHLAT